jgi:hypothetical protein
MSVGHECWFDQPATMAGECLRTESCSCSCSCSNFGQRHFWQYGYEYEHEHDVKDFPQECWFEQPATMTGKRFWTESCSCSCSCYYSYSYSGSNSYQVDSPSNRSIESWRVAG